MSAPVLGVIGGLGPLATANFLELMTKMTQAPAEQDHMDMIVYNFPSIPDRTGYILGSNLRSPLPGLLWAGRELERQDVCAIAIPCVTALYFYEDMSRELRRPIIHDIRETAKYLKERGVGSVGIMATEGAVTSGIFSQELLPLGIRPILPDRDTQQDVTHLIYKNIKAGVSPEMDRFRRAEQHLRNRGAEVILLGATELSVLAKDHALGKGFLDTTRILARESILRCGKRLKPEYDELISA